MKKLILLTLLIVGCATVSYENFPNYNNTTGKFIYEEVVQVDEENNADILFDKIHQWIALNYNSANDVIQLNDKINHMLIIKGNYITNVLGVKESWYPHTLEIKVKDGRFKYTITVHKYKDLNNEMAFNSNSLGFKNKIFADVDMKVKSTILNMTNHIKLEKMNQNDDW